MRGVHIQIAVAAALLLAACSSAPPRPPHWTPFTPQRSEAWHDCRSVLLRYDSNNDGTVTREELEAGIKQFFWQADTNHDGRLDPDEVAAANHKRILLDGTAAIPLIDWNQDGYVDYNEFASGPRSLFDQLDLNGDGEVTPDELRRASC
jgi:EF hand domain-containing protein